MVYKSVLLLGGLLLVPVAGAHAQYIGGRAPAPPPAPVAGSFESPEAALARNVRLLAINPRDYLALLGAGRAALRLGDAEAAIGFFGRAEELQSEQWPPKAGQASALTQMGEAATALGLFEQAQRLGALQAQIALDRGLAFDLLGRQAEAQSDYRVVLGGAEGDEARRRLALSLAISGRKAEALTLLDPLLARRDPGARRARAFVLALGGDMVGARAAIGAMMGGASSGFDPFLSRLATLGPGQKAAAVHLGIMPATGAALAAAEPEPTAPVVARVAEPAPRVASVTRRQAPPPREAAPRTDRLAEVESTLIRLPETRLVAAASPAPPPAPRPIVEKKKAKAATDDTAKAVRLAAFTICPKGTSAIRAAKLDCDLAPRTAALKDCPAGTTAARALKLKCEVKVKEAALEACPAGTSAARALKLKCDPKLKLAELEPCPKGTSTAKAAKLKCDPKAREAALEPCPKGTSTAKAAKLKCDPKARAEEDEGKGVKLAAGSQRLYVQLAGGSNADQMEREFARIRAKKASLFKGRTPVVAAMKGWSRLLVGPFKDNEAAQDFVNDLHGAKLEGFAWTAPAGTRIEKLGQK